MSDLCDLSQVTDTTTFTSEKKREKEDYWLYETCRRCLQHLIDVFVLVSAHTRHTHVHKEASTRCILLVKACALWLKGWAIVHGGATTVV